MTIMATPSIHPAPTAITRTRPLRRAFRALSPYSPPAVIAGILLVTLAMIPMAQGDALSSGLTLSRMSELGLLFLGAAVLALHASARQCLRQPFASPIFRTISVFCAWAALSCCWSHDPTLSIAKSVELWVLCLSAGWAAALLKRDDRPQRALVNRMTVTMLLVLAILLCVNFVQYKTPLYFTNPVHIDGRVRLIFAGAHPLLSGAVLALTMIAIFSSDLSLWLKLLLTPALLVLLWWTDARACVAALAIASIGMCLIKLPPKGKRVAWTVAAAALFLFFIFYGQGALDRPIDEFMDDDIATLDGRTDVWAYAVSLIKEQPIQGCGYYSSRFYLMNLFSWAGDAHNSFLEATLSTGFVGLGILLVYTAQVFRLMWTRGYSFLAGVVLLCYLEGLMEALLMIPSAPMFLVTLTAMICENPPRAQLLSAARR